MPRGAQNKTKAPIKSTMNRVTDPNYPADQAVPDPMQVVASLAPVELPPVDLSETYIGPGIDKGPEVAAQPSVVAQLTKLLDAGMSEEEALLIINRRLGQDVPAGNPSGFAPNTPGAAKAPNQSLDSEMERQKALYAQRMANYVPPKLDEEFAVKMPVRFADYVRRWAAMESIKRGREVTPEDAIQMIVRQFWQGDNTRALLEGGGKTGPASAFNATTGTYTG
jgi:hypothetical protein